MSTTPRIESSNIVTKTLPNGLTVIVKQDRSSPIVAVNVWFGVGSVHETEEMNGLAHFQEHMVFKGTEKYGVGDIARIVKSAGGNLNAGTSYSYTMYYVVLPSREFATALEVQADAMMHSTFDPHEFTKERLVVIDEARMYDDRPESFTFYRTMELGFQKHTYRRPIAGYQDIVEKITRDQLVAFYNNYYRPKNAVLVVVGDVGIDDALARIEKAYGGWRDGSVVVNEPPAEPQQEGLRFKAFVGPMDHAYLGAGFHVPSIMHEDYPALQMLGELVSSGKSSRFYQRVREEKRLVTSAGADLLAEKWPGMFLIFASMPPSKWESATGALLTEIERFKQDLVSETELDKARRQVERALYREWETMEGQASTIGYYQLLGDYRLADRHREAIQRVTPDEIMHVARTYFRPANLSLVGYLPKSVGTQALTEERVKGLVESALSSSAAPVEKTAPKPARAAAAVRAQSSAADESRVTSFELTNGVRVLLKRRPNVPLVSMLTIFPGGGQFEPEGQSGLSMLTHRVLTKGGAKYNAEEIAEKIEGLGGSIDSFSSFDTGGVSVGVLSDYAEEAAEIYRDVLREPRFDVGRVEQEKTRLLEELQRRHDNPVPFAMDQMFRDVFGTHPYAYPFLGESADVNALAARDCTEWYHSLLVPGRVVLSIVGDLSIERAERIAERLLGDLGDRAGAAPRHDPPKLPVQPGEHVLRRAGIKQAVTFVGFTAPPMETPNSIAMEVANGVLTGLGGRLFVELRDKRSLGYMTGSQYHPLYRGGVFFGYANPGAEGIEEAVRVILHELDVITREPVSDDELDRAKEWLAGSHIMELQRNGAQALGYGSYEALGFGWPEMDRIPEKIRAVTKEDVLAACKATFVRNNAVIVRMLPE